MRKWRGFAGERIEEEEGDEEEDASRLTLDIEDVILG